MAVSLERYIEVLGDLPDSIKPAMREVVRDQTTQLLNIIPTLHTSRSGALASSWRASYENDGLTGSVSTNKKYAPAQERGSGLHAALPIAGERYDGPALRSKYPIYPRNAAALYWPGIKGDRPVAMVMHPGVKPQFFMRRAVERIEQPFMDSVSAASIRIVTGER